MRDVLIVGGGPAGLYAGWQLARAGFDVEIVEEHARAGEPVHCTGVLAADAFDRFGLPDDSVLNPLRTVRFHAPSGESISYSTPAVEAVVIDRARFDATIAQRASAAGARIACGERVTRVDAEDDGVSVVTHARTIRGRMCVLACGATYAVQRKQRLGIPRLLLHTAQAELPAERLGEVEVYFGAHVAPRGFAWAVPVRRERPHVRVGVMCERHAAAYFARVLGNIADRWGIAGTDACQPRQKILPLGPIGRTFGDRLLVVGDAAGVVKPTTGGGIYYSLLTAGFAVETIAAAFARGDLSASSLSAYETQWRNRLGSELRWQLVMRRIAQRLSDREIEGLFELARTDGLMPLVRRTAAFNQHRDFIVALLKHPPARRVLFKAALA